MTTPAGLPARLIRDNATSFWNDSKLRRGTHVLLLMQMSSPLGAPKEGAVVTWFSVARPRLASLPGAAGRRWQSISPFSRREASRAAYPVSELAQQQASLRRVATLVAQGVPPVEVFRAVADELAYAIGVDHTSLVRFEPDGSGIIVAAHNEAGLKAMPVGARVDLEGDNVAAMVWSTGRAARMNTHEDAAGPAAALIRDLGYRSGVGVPVIVDGRVWGTAIVGSSSTQPPPADTESRLRDFAELVATAIANADSRAELMASRARIVAAADDARRRFERDLHDGAQQRLVSLGLMLRAVQDSIPSHLPAVKGQVSDVIAGLLAANEELRELSHGLHPNILSRGGLGPAIRSLARRSAVPVELDLDVERRLPECVEVTTY